MKKRPKDKGDDHKLAMPLVKLQSITLVCFLILVCPVLVRKHALSALFL